MTFFVAGFMTVLGIAGVILGGADDSPGLQGIGLLLILGAIAYTVKSVRTTRRNR
ncbi:hypothetical protein LZG04_17850 [Saccharothrix sp. S26]|uniref:hypothetical protein n=1 Tax=Saccharothrix sp. S26 TaxID=2907215 RepID=UPI001F40C660|nr:hypothetical protein [Saccharothrix sp. S26]MCE6996652.1 hypothetical protein [Saccharothrix sp. S26]